MLSVLHHLICKYDGIGWIPTVRGCLSLEVIDNAENILGDVDKYSVRFKTTRKLCSQHYLIASSLLTVNDSKAGDEFDRSFRYIFTGSINDDDDVNTFLKREGLTEDTSLKAYINEKGLLLGRLIIVASEEVDDGESENKYKCIIPRWLKTIHHLTKREVFFLTKLENLSEKNDHYRKLFNVDAASMDCLQKERQEMFLLWKELRKIAENIGNDKESKRPTFKFDVALTRDGILLLRDVTDIEYRDYFAKENTADDYKTNIALHRLFKSAMNYVKYLFHNNYHHNEEHDTYLPASNLHPAKETGNWDLYPVFRHQMDAFMVPIIKQKRSNFSSYTVDPIGILLYAKAFIRVFESNNLVNRKATKNAKEYCEFLQKEIEQMTSKDNTIVRALIANHNLYVIISGLLAFVFACLKTIDLLGLQIRRDLIPCLPIIERPFNSIGKFVILSLVGYLLYIIPRSILLKKQFRLREKSRSKLFKDSNLREEHFSWRYELYIKWNTFWLKTNEGINALFYYMQEILKQNRQIKIRYNLISIITPIGFLLFILLAFKILMYFLQGEW